MCPVYTLYLTALISKFYSTGVGGKIIFCRDEIEKKFVAGVLGLKWTYF